MSAIETITTDYSEHEDRICLSGRDKSGHILQLWLTRRLSDRLLQNLLNGFEQKVPGGDHSDILQNFEQEKAVSEINHGERVVPVAQSQVSSCLIDNIDVKRTEDAIGLIFKVDQQVQASIGFSAREMRQWLSICYIAYQKAQWPLEIWPEWIKTEQETVNVPHSVQVH